MFEVTCLDSNGNTINNFTQWDVDQKITLVLKGYDIVIAPQVHFCNKNVDEALVVRSTIIDENTIVADVPNSLLREHYPLLIYIYLTDGEDVSSQRTILSTEIPVRKRTKPSDYFYTENIERITAEQIKEEVKSAIVDEINSNDIMFSSVTLVDTVTGTPYKIYAANHYIHISDEVDLNDVALNSITFFNTEDNPNMNVHRKYKVYVSEGDVFVTEVEEDKDETEVEEGEGEV